MPAIHPSEFKRKENNTEQTHLKHFVFLLPAFVVMDRKVKSLEIWPYLESP